MDYFIDAKRFAYKHRVALLTGALVIVTTVAVARGAGLRSHDEFLKTHDLYDEYYALTED
jgi:hypothetical protein